MIVYGIFAMRPSRIGLLFTVFVILVCVAHIPAEPADRLTGTVTVIDGDTIEIHGQRVRLFGIDAPESAQTCEAGGKAYRCGQQAALALADEIGRRTVSCNPRDVDRYGRIVAVCAAGDEDLNAWMVRHGWALAYRQYSTAYVPDEEGARAAGAGIWRGTFTPPWDWRHGQASGAAAPESASQPAGGCLIKGNISRSGERIYHLPGQRYYDRTRIDASKGERWFCSEAEAQAAGWRRSRL